jgi:uroporphyrinogen-III synthase
MSKQPLAGKRILITRAEHQASHIVEQVKQSSAIPIIFPCLELLPCSTHISNALKHISHFSDVLFTSSNGVTAVAQTSTTPLKELFSSHRIAAVGNKTAQALCKHDVATDIIPDHASQEGLIQAYQDYGYPKSLLFFRAADGNDVLQTYLQEQGVEVQRVQAYQSICPNHDSSDVIALLQQQRIDAVMLASPKTASHYLQRIGDLELANRPIIVTISEQVADAADKLGLKVQLIAKETSFSSMLEALTDYYS